MELEAGVLEFGCDETQEVGRTPHSFSAFQNSGPSPFLVISASEVSGAVADNRFQLGRLEFGNRTFRFLRHGEVLMSGRR